MRAYNCDITLRIIEQVTNIIEQIAVKHWS